MKQFRICIAALLLLSASLAVAEPPHDTGKPDKPGQGKPDKSQGADVELARGGINVEAARGLAREFGVTGQKPLPPGIRKNLARGKPMPPGIQKTRLPDGYLGRLPVHQGYRWERMGTDLLLVHDETDVVADLLPEVFD